MRRQTNWIVSALGSQGARDNFGISFARCHADAQDAEVDVEAMDAAHYWNRGRMSRARRRRARLNLLAWLFGRYIWPRSSPFSRRPLSSVMLSDALR